MICPKCGTANPRFFKKCIECGAFLPVEDPARAKARILVYAGAGLLGLATLVVIALTIPVIGGWISAHPVISHPAPASAVPQISQFSINESAEYGGLQMIVSGVRDGTMFNDRKFYTVTMGLKNSQASKTLHFTASDFLLIDSQGKEISPVGIGDGITFDLAPGSSGTVDLRYIVDTNTSGLKIRIDPRTPLGETSTTMMFYDFVL